LSFAYIKDIIKLWRKLLNFKKEEIKVLDLETLIAKIGEVVFVEMEEVADIKPSIGNTNILTIVMENGKQYLLELKELT